ncbi:MAG: hypothetical protein ACQCN3_15760 [Candidatus Bathyarchaeia archaeon]
MATSCPLQISPSESRQPYLTINPLATRSAKFLDSVNNSPGLRPYSVSTCTIQLLEVCLTFTPCSKPKRAVQFCISTRRKSEGSKPSATIGYRY